MPKERVPRIAFLDPTGSNYKDVTDLTARFFDVIHSLGASACTRPPYDGRVQLPVAVEIPPEPIAEERILEQLRLLIEASTNIARPDFIARMDTISTTLSAVGDYAAAVANVNMIGFEVAPACSLLEYRLMKEFARMFGLGEAAGGVINSGGSLANLHALAVARNSKLNTLHTGISPGTRRPVLFVSEVGHSSIPKAASILGLGTEAVIPISTDGHSRMKPKDLAGKVQQAITEGKQPFCVVATVGSTQAGAIDPLPEVYEIAKAHDLWLHADAAWGGGLIFSETHQHKLKGIENADSIIMSAHKLLMVARTAAITLFRDWEGMQSHFRIPLPYMVATGDYPNLSEVCIQGGKSAEVIKLWLSLLHIGKSGYQRILDRGMELIDTVAGLLAQRNFIKLHGSNQTGILCFRGTPNWVAEEGWDDWTDGLHSHLWRNAGIYTANMRYKGQRYLGIVFRNPYLEEGVLHRMAEQIDLYAKNSGQPRSPLGGSSS